MMVSADDWRGEFGLRDGEGKSFVSSKAEIPLSEANASQGHVLRRAFDLLRLDGVLSVQNTPLVYFKRVRKIEPAEVYKLHKAFWNHGGAPILVLVSDEDVHIYSALIRPVEATTSTAIPSLVQSLKRASVALAEFLPTVESGEFFRRHARSFQPGQRVDRDLLDNLLQTRQKLASLQNSVVGEQLLDALLCRLVFACYLFDRGVIGATFLSGLQMTGAAHLRDILGLQPPTYAKDSLYDLFRKLGRDFNGDLFSDDLEDEAQRIPVAFVEVLNQFFSATNVATGQQSFWPYDFGVIPIEAISAIYERFLQGKEKKEGAFYTPRFLAELVIDLALTNCESLLTRRYLDPACGSGIFLVGLFNRMAEEWKQKNPEARNDRRARELRKLLCEGLYGVDLNPTACRITAFSLYLAYLDQLSPRDIDELREKGHRLPKLVHYAGSSVEHEIEGNIWCGDFFAIEDSLQVDTIVGNPPWGSLATQGTGAEYWCANSAHRRHIPDNQISAAFAWKAPCHVGEAGRICFILPHGTLFNHGATAVAFQKDFFTRHAVEQVLNLTDYQFFLFAEARHPAIVMVYRKSAPPSRSEKIQYWSPKSDWLVTRAEVIAISPDDRCTVTVGQVLQDLKGPDAPLIWKQWYWASGRDRRLLERLALYPRLRDHVRQARDKRSEKRWSMTEGFQPLGKNDDPEKAKAITLPSKLFIQATSKELDLFLLPDDCTLLSSNVVSVRNRSNKRIDAFRAPHVLVSKGFTRVAYADFDVSFRHALRGISGPHKDRDLLMFLCAYLRSPLARYFLFHTSSNWGVSRQEVHVAELMRVPFMLPENTNDPERSWQIVREVGALVEEAAALASSDPIGKRTIVRNAEKAISVYIDEYFDILDEEAVLIEDTSKVLIPSARPSRNRIDVPSVSPSTGRQGSRYTERLAGTLNAWAAAGSFEIQAYWLASSSLGVGMVMLEKRRRGTEVPRPDGDLYDVLTALMNVNAAAKNKLNTFELIRGVKVFDRNRLYLVKPIAHRFWTETAALNDADEIAGTILMHASREAEWQS